MECKNHGEREAVAICVSCGQPLCGECDTMIQGKHYCGKCGERATEIPDRDRVIAKSPYYVNSFLWFIFSLVPGAGHMYMGLMKRGVVLLAAFLGAVALNELIYLGGIGVLAGMLVFVYAFFDSLGVKKALQRGEVVEDEGFEQISLKNINIYYVGIAIIALGAFSLLRSSMNYIGFLSPIVREIIYGIERSIFPILLIVGGLWLIKRSKNEKQQSEEE